MRSSNASFALLKRRRPPLPPPRDAQPRDFQGLVRLPTDPFAMVQAMLPKPVIMVGVITTKHLLTHGHLIVAEFGARAYLRCIGRCIFSSKPTTFLECVFA